MLITQEDSPSPSSSTVHNSHNGGQQQRLGGFLGFFKSSSFKIYLCHVFSSWGDRMWGFAVGLYMIILFPDSLLLTAIYGFSNCLSGIIFGPYIGGWIDKTQRLTAAKCSVIVQNTAVVAGAIVLALTLHFQSPMKSAWDGGLQNLLFSIIIIIAIVADLASVANKIALEKDWIVVLAGGDNKQLAKLNSTMRTINLTTSILAPIVVGQIIHFGSPVAGALFIALWNVISGIIEYKLLLEIYEINPSLGLKAGDKNDIPFIKINSPGTDSSADGDGRNSTPSKDDESSGSEPIVRNNNNNAKDMLNIRSTFCVNDNEFTPAKNTTTMLTSPGPDFEDVSLVTPVSNNKLHVSGPRGAQPNGRKGKRTICVACDGCRSYFSHHVKFAGLGLASLYMTVLGFDSITSGFVYSQGVNESVIGIVTAIGAVFGILGSLSFPSMRKRFGKNRTGILGFSLETLSLLFCVGSIFAIGSPFKVNALWERFENISGSSSSSYYTRPTASLQEIWEKEYHVILLLLGIVVARFGLWIADLSVTQIFQEEVEESQRGLINGVQDSLNKFMDLLKFALVILLPSAETFGYLIILSWLFVFLGTMSFLVFTITDRRRTKRLAQISPEINISIISKD